MPAPLGLAIAASPSSGRARRFSLKGRLGFPVLVTGAVLASAGAGTALAQSTQVTPESTSGAPTHPIVRQLEDENRRLVETRSGPEGFGAKAEALAAELEAARSTLERVRADFARTRERVEMLGLERAGGLLLVAKRGQLPAISELGRRNLRHSLDLRQAQIEELRLVTQRGRIAGRIDDEVDVVTGRIGLLEASEEAAIRAAIREALEARLGVLDGLIADADRYLTLLFELDAVDRELSAETLRYDTYVKERVLWIPTDTVLDLEEILGSGRVLGWLLDPSAWKQAGGAAGRYLAARGSLSVLVAVLLVSLLPFRLGWWPRRGAAPGTGASLGAALLRALLTASFLPTLVWSTAWVLTSAPDVPPLGVSIGVGLERIATIMLVVELVLAVFREDGVATTFLRWRPAEAVALRRSCHPLLTFAPAVVLGIACISYFGESGDRFLSGAGRLALLVALGVLFVPVRRILHPAKGVIAARLAVPPGSWPARLRSIAYVAARAFVWATMILVVLGYGQTAGTLISALFASVAVVLAAAILDGVARDRVRSATPDGDASTPDPAESHFRRIRAALILAAGVALLIVWSSVLPAVLYLNSIRLWAVEGSTGPEAVTAASILFLVALLAATVVAVRVAPGILDSALSGLQVERSVRYASGIVAQYVLMITGTMLAFGQLRIGWSKVQWLVAGLSVGVGFGLQEIVANFIAGIVILFERPIRLGDTVTVGETTGTVTAIHVRATTIRDFDRKTLIVPNKELITSRVTNWDLSDRMRRTQIPVRVAYGSDPSKVAELLLRAARECPMTLATPPPKAILSEFGERALVFRLYVFLATGETVLEARHWLHAAIVRIFEEAGITMGSPQIDVHLDGPAPQVGAGAVRSQGGL
jgi:potassium efflux system protein